MILLNQIISKQWRRIKVKIRVDIYKSNFYYNNSIDNTSAVSKVMSEGRRQLEEFKKRCIYNFNVESIL